MSKQLDWKREQSVAITDDVTFNDITCSTLDTGQGAYELYAMDQDVKQTSNVNFGQITLSGTLKSSNITNSAGYDDMIITGSDTIGGALTLLSTSHATKGKILISEDTDSTSSTTGALVVTGGIGIAKNIFCAGSIKGVPILAGIFYSNSVNSVSGFGFFSTMNAGFKCGYDTSGTSATDQQFTTPSGYNQPSSMISKLTDSSIDYVKFLKSGLYRISFQMSNEAPGTAAVRYMLGASYFSSSPPNPGTNDKDTSATSTGGVSAIDLTAGTSMESSGVHFREMNANDSMRLYYYCATSNTGNLYGSIIIEYYGGND